VLFWKVDGKETSELGKVVLPNQKLVRKATYIAELKRVVAITDDGRLWQYKLNEKETINFLQP
jgi:hypothetical protein